MLGCAVRDRSRGGFKICQQVCVAVLCCLGLFGQSAIAEETLPGPLLTLSFAQQEVALEAEQLLALPQQTVATHTAWTDDVKVFQGPLMRDLLALLDGLPEQGTARLIAWNDYEIEVPLSDFKQWDVLAAHTMDGQRLTLADRGPLWVVYPRDQDPQLRDSRYDHRWAWMLRAISVAP